MDNNDATYRLRVNITIERHSKSSGWSGDRLSVIEEADIDVPSFLEAASILGQFHALTEAFK